MDLWWKTAGFLRLRITSADCAGCLRLLTQQGVRLEQIDWCSELTAELSIQKSQWKLAQALLQKRRADVEILHRAGLPRRVRSWMRYPIVLGALAVILAGTLFLPGRVLFLRVQGNGDVPARLILEKAEAYGVFFGASRRDIRSERVKNGLLHEIPALRWAGVNTSGCVATITVTPREAEIPQAQDTLPASIVALRDAVVTDVTVTAGTALCTPGQAVTAGQVLISGYTDLGLCNRVQRADGEIFGITNRSVRAVLPLRTARIVPSGEILRKYSLLIGKKRINFHADSGILYPGCGKMTEVQWLTLPGGWELPIALVVECYDLTTLEYTDRGDCTDHLERTALRHLREAMIAGEVRHAQCRTETTDDLWILSGDYECREMIGILRQGVYLEGETKDDRENGERGAG